MLSEDLPNSATYRIPNRARSFTLLSNRTWIRVLGQSPPSQLLEAGAVQGSAAHGAFREDQVRCKGAAVLLDVFEQPQNWSEAR